MRQPHTMQHCQVDCAAHLCRQVLVQGLDDKWLNGKEHLERLHGGDGGGGDWWR